MPDTPGPLRHPGAADGATAAAFVPAQLDATRWANLEPLYRALAERDVASFDDLERWLVDRNELDAAASEAKAELYIAMTCHTDDPAHAGAWTAYLDEVPPRLKPVSFELDRRQVELAEAFPAPTDRYAVLDRALRNDVELFREESVPLETELAKLDQEYDAVCGDMLVEFEGESRTLPQMGRFQEDNDRARRESAWRAVQRRREQDAGRIDDIFDRMIELRQTVASNAGFGDFRDYQHRRLGRFDYTPDDCARFHDAIEKHAVPFMRELDERRRSALGLETLRPWDLAVDERGRDPLTPFDGGQDLVEKSRRVFDALDPELAALFERLGDNLGDAGALDLDSRKGKASGGYQYTRDRSRTAFIFMNAAGLHRDVETMVHEAGHAFHAMLSSDDPILAYRHSYIEFAEVASMTQELLTMPHWGAYYPDPADADRARRRQLEGSVALLPWIATIDAFQQRLYTAPGHSRADRAAIWLELDERFGHAVDWSGLDAERAGQWRRQGHLFGVPFYYVEYGIAQLGALGIWRNALERGVGPALADYKAALALGGSRPLPELFERAGVPFDFGERRVGELVDAVRRALDDIPE